MSRAAAYKRRLEMFREGMPYRRIAQIEGITERAIQKWMAAHGLRRKA